MRFRFRVAAGKGGPRNPHGRRGFGRGVPGLAESRASFPSSGFTKWKAPQAGQATASNSRPVASPSPGLSASRSSYPCTISLVTGQRKRKGFPTDQGLRAKSGVALTCVNRCDRPAYTAPKRTTMVFDDACRTIDDPDGEVRPLWTKVATGG